MKKICTFLLATSFVYTTFSQSGSVGIGTVNPNPSAVLDITSTDKGILLPRISSAQRMAINSPATGLIVFDTDKKLLYFYNGLQWVPLVPGDPVSATQSMQMPDDIEHGDYLGRSVAVSGDYAIVGAHGDDEVASDAGCAYIYFRNGGQWVQQVKLTAPDGAASDYFGLSVDISGDYAVVGAPGHDAVALNHGAVYVFRRNGSSWGQVNKLASPTPLQELKFGNAVSIDGDNMAVGCPGFTSVGGQVFEQCGKVDIFRRTGAAWNIVASPVPVLQDGAGFGTSLSLQGNFLVAGAPYEDVDGETDAGAAYIYGQIFGSWGLDRRLTAPSLDINNYNYFGISVDVNNNTAIVGMPTYQERGKFFVYSRVLEDGSFVWNNDWVLGGIELGPDSELGVSVALDGDYAIVGDNGLGIGFNRRQGASFIYKRIEVGAWTHFKTLIANPANPYDEMGVSVAIQNNVAITGIAVFNLNGTNKPRVLFSEVQ